MDRRLIHCFVFGLVLSKRFHVLEQVIVPYNSSQVLFSFVDDL